MYRKSAASLASVASIVAILCGTAPAASAKPESGGTFGPVDLPAGTACTGFDVRVEGVDSKRHVKEFTDAEGNPVRTITAGKGYTLTFTNLATDQSITFESNGSVERTTVGADGTSTTAVTGHNVIILFPTDVPAGPSTTLYVGRTTYTVSVDGVWTIQSTSGSSVDICAALSY